MEQLHSECVSRRGISRVTGMSRTTLGKWLKKAAIALHGKEATLDGMGKAYSQDLRVRVLAALDGGMSKMAAHRTFRISWSTIDDWVALRAAPQHVRPQALARRGHNQRLLMWKRSRRSCISSSTHSRFIRRRTVSGNVALSASRVGAVDRSWLKARRAGRYS
jgi:hypothetical protein